MKQCWMHQFISEVRKSVVFGALSRVRPMLGISFFAWWPIFPETKRLSGTAVGGDGCQSVV
jgi:hypothetical protein